MFKVGPLIGTPQGGARESALARGCSRKTRTGLLANSPKKRASLARAAVEGLISPIASTK